MSEHHHTEANAARLLHPSRQGASPLDTSVLEDIAAGLAAVAPEGLVAAAWELVRLPVLETEAYDAWVMVWGPAALLRPHDHDGSVGVMHVVTGELLETMAPLDEPDRSSLRRLHDGDTAHLGATSIHGLFNPTARSAVTVNVYSPPLGRAHHES